MSGRRQLGELSPVPGSVGPGPALLAPFVLAALIRQSPRYSSLIPSCVLALREVGLAGERAAAQPEPAVEAPERPEDGQTIKELHHNKDSVTIATHIICNTT